MSRPLLLAVGALAAAGCQFSFDGLPIVDRDFAVPEDAAAPVDAAADLASSDDRALAPDLAAPPDLATADLAGDPCAGMPDGTICAPPGCAGDSQLTSSCLAGACVARSAGCFPYSCQPDAGACYTSCTSSAECAQGSKGCTGGNFCH